jgi:hypothetical protein
MTTMTLTAPIAAPRARHCGASGVGARTTSAARPRVRRAAVPVAGRHSSLRLTRRGRLVVFVLSLALCAAGSLAVTSSGAASGTAEHVPVQYVTVLPGDTLWTIANDVAPGADRRDTVAEIIELNALAGSSVRAGQRLAVPVHP